VASLSGEEAKAAMRGLDSVAPVGTGIVVTQDGDFPVIRSLVGGGPAEKSNQIKQGDVILAVAQNGDSNFTDAKGMDSGKISPLLRGEKGTPVQLRVQSAETKEVRTITIQRDRFQSGGGGGDRGPGGGGFQRRGRS
jgi:C-terminal processing protease CtpA/Prc